MNPFTNLRSPTFVFTFLILIIAIIFSSPSKYLAATRSFVAQRFYSKTSISEVNQVTQAKMTTRTPVYFFSHGGPTVTYNTDHPVYPQLQKIGKEITQKVKPRAIVAFSAHWQGEPNTILINTAPFTDLVYDFYGFPSHYYTQTFPNTGSPEVAQEVISKLTSAGIKVKPVTRGLDHGIFSCFHVAFDPVSNPLNIPIIQVSLFNTEDALQHLALGKAIAGLREQNIQIIVSGMAVHNLRDFRFGTEKVMGYSKSFDEALREAVESDPEERGTKMVQLMGRTDLRQAHPTVEHLLPIYIGAGAAGEDRGKRLWTYLEGPLSWAQYRFGDVPGEA